MINIKTIDSRSMLAAFEMNNQMYLSGPPYALDKARLIDNKFLGLPTFLTFKNGPQFTEGMKQFQKIFANHMTQNIITKYAAGMTKNFTPSETRALMIRRLEDAVAKFDFPDMVLHELHALQMTSGFTQNEKTKINMILRDADESLKPKIESRLATETIDYEENIEGYLNAIVHYATLFEGEESTVAQEALEKSMAAIANITSRFKNSIPSSLKAKMEKAYSEISKEHEKCMHANGEFKVKPWQWKHNLDEPGLRLDKK